jgi:hypothetical protein
MMIRPEFSYHIIWSFFAHRTFMAAIRAQRMEVTTKINAKGTGVATFTHHGIHKFVGGVVNQGKTMLLSADI